MNIFIFRSDIESKKKVKYLKPLFNNHLDILKWSIDIEDIDNVIRIESTLNLKENDIIEMIQPHGFYIEPLPE